MVSKPVGIDSVTGGFTGRAKTWLDSTYQSLLAINPMNYGATGNGTTDDTTAVQNALAAAQAAGRDLCFPPGTYKMSGTLTFSPYLGSVRGSGLVVLDFTSLTSGTAITIAPATAADGDGRGHEDPGCLEGLILHGPHMVDTDPGPYVADAVATQSAFTSDAVEHVEIHNVTIVGFRDGIVLGNNAWSQRVVNSYISRCRRYGVNFGNLSNSYENFVLLNTTIAGCKNTAASAYGLFAQTGNADVVMVGGSLDYNDHDGWMNAGQFRFFGVHIEAHSDATITAPAFTVQSVSGQVGCSLEFHGCAFVQGTRPTLINENGSSTAIATVSLFGCTFGYQGTPGLLIKTGPGLIVASVSGTTPGTFFQSGGTYQFGTPLNALLNGGFESTLSTQSTVLPTGRIQVTGGITLTRDTTQFHYGAASGKCVTAGTAGTMGITAPVQSMAAVATGWVKVTAYTAGTLTFQVQWYDSAGNTLGSAVSVAGNTTAVTAGWVAFGSALVVPAGAAYGQLQASITSTPTMTAYVDDLELVFI